MTTAYITSREHLDGILGQAIVETADAALLANIDAIIRGANAIADGYVSAQLGSGAPRIEAAVAMVAPIAAELCWVSLYANSGDTEALTRREKAAMAKLLAVAKSELRLPMGPPVDDPATPEDESDTGAAFSASPRLMTRRQLAGW